MRIVLDIEEEDIERIVKARIISTLYLWSRTLRTAGTSGWRIYLASF